LLPQDLCRSSRHHYRERPAVSRLKIVEQQTATSEILRHYQFRRISTALNTIAQNGGLCEAQMHRFVWLMVK
jgi:hypothetical protein